MEQPIIQPISKELLKSELTSDKQLRMTNKSNNEIYIITAHDAPNVMREIGRLREIAFREAGGGTGKDAMPRWPMAMRRRGHSPMTSPSSSTCRMPSARVMER